ncbi:hypothetical protein N9R94_00370 [bacterium]|jgi:hypothetical protein|nr:hypothetical protein [bacterium]
MLPAIDWLEINVLHNARRQSRESMYHTVAEAGFMESKKKCRFRTPLKFAGIDFACAESLNVFPVNVPDARNRTAH